MVARRRIVIFLHAVGCARVAPSQAPVTIAVIDDGVTVSRPELRDRIDVNIDEVPANGIDDDDNGLADDRAGYDFLDSDPDVEAITASGDASHGTAIAMIALNASVIFGTDDRSREYIKILPLRAANERMVDSDAVALAIDYAANRGHRVVVNLSLATIFSALPPQVVSAILRHRDVLFVVAAGNQGRQISALRASLCRLGASNIVCVASVDNNGRLGAAPKASNYGPEVPLAAVGVDVKVLEADGSVRTRSGTSLAAAYVSGVAARLWSSLPDLGASDIANSLCRGARRTDVLGDRVGCGIVDLGRSLRLSERGTPGS